MVWGCLPFTAKNGAGCTAVRRGFQETAAMKRFFFGEADGARSFSRFSERCPSQLGVDCNSESAPQLLSRIRVLEPGEEASRAMEVVQSKAKPPEDTISTAQLPAAWAI